MQAPAKLADVVWCDRTNSCREHHNELPDKMLAKDEPARSLEYRYNWKADLKSTVDADDSISKWRGRKG
jgi:hypothetical protein